jgi:endonuclease-3 related protein
VVEKVSREGLLKVKGIGKETADAILLYAGGRLNFVIDAYTKRLFKRLYGLDGGYEDLKSYVEENIPKDLTIYKEFHALIDEHAKAYCKSTPRCGGCFLKNFCLSAIPSS